MKGGFIEVNMVKGLVTGGRSLDMRGKGVEVMVVNKEKGKERE